MRAAAFFVVLLLAGCGGARPAVEAAPVAAPDMCDAAKAAALVGRRMAAGLAETARATTGAKAVRTIRPGTMVTMDYRADRLNLTVDGQGIVTAIRCG